MSKNTLPWLIPALVIAAVLLLLVMSTQLFNDSPRAVPSEPDQHSSGMANPAVHPSVRAPLDADGRRPLGATSALTSDPGQEGPDAQAVCTFSFKCFSDSAHPIRNLRAVFWSLAADIYEPAALVTDADALTTTEPLPQPDGYLLLTADGHEPCRVRAAGVGSVDLGLIRLRSGRETEIIVTGPAGEPVAGARIGRLPVEAELPRNGQRFFEYGALDTPHNEICRTDQYGRAMLALRSNAKLFVSHESYAVRFVVAGVARDDSAPRTVRVTLPELRRVTLIVDSPAAAYLRQTRAELAIGCGPLTRISHIVIGKSIDVGLDPDHASRLRLSIPVCEVSSITVGPDDPGPIVIRIGPLQAKYGIVLAEDGNGIQVPIRNLSGPFQYLALSDGRLLVAGSEGAQDITFAAAHAGEPARAYSSRITLDGTFQAPTAVTLRAQRALHLEGVVAEDSGGGLGGALVQVYAGGNLSVLHNAAAPDAAARTDSNGRYKIPLPCGLHWIVSASSDGCSVESSVVGPADDWTSVDFALTAGFDVAGRVIDHGGRPASFALVLLQRDGEDDPNRLVTADAAGAFTFRQVAGGSYLIRGLAEALDPATIQSCPDTAGAWRRTLQREALSGSVVEIARETEGLVVVADDPGTSPVESLTVRCVASDSSLVYRLLLVPLFDSGYFAGPQQLIGADGEVVFGCIMGGRYVAVVVGVDGEVTALELLEVGRSSQAVDLAVGHGSIGVSPDAAAAGWQIVEVRHELVSLAAQSPLSGQEIAQWSARLTQRHAAGILVAEHLVPGQYDVRMRRPGTDNEFLQTGVAVRIGEATPVEPR